METAVFWLVILGPVIIGIAVAVYYGGSKTFALWTGFVGCVLLLLAGGLQWQQAIWKSQEPPDEATVKRLRAYVYAIDADINHVVGSGPTVSVTIKNTGQTPALELTWRAKFALAVTGEADKIMLDDNAVASKTTLPHDGVLSYQYTFPNWLPKYDDMLKAETAAIYAVGEIKYKDTYGNERFTNYRLMSGGSFAISTGIAPGKFGIAPGGNDSN
jgi:hypothetical protein